MSDPLTLPEAEARQVRSVIELLQAVLGPDLLALYLHGSAVGAGLRAESDLDLFAIVARSLGREERRAIVAGMLDRSRPSGRPEAVRPLELSMVTAAAVRPWRYPPPLELQYGDWWRRELAAGETPWASADPDLAILVTTVRADGRALVGPGSSALLDPVPAADVVHATRAAIPGLLLDLDADTRNVLLTLARVVVTIETGDIVAKDIAADHLLATMPADLAGALRVARDGYVGRAVDRWDAPTQRAAARATAAWLVGRIDAAASPAA